MKTCFVCKKTIDGYEFRTFGDIVVCSKYKCVKILDNYKKNIMSMEEYNEKNISALFKAV